MPLLEYWPVAVVAASAAIGYGELKSNVRTLRRDVDEKASKEIVGTQYGEIIRRLDRIEDRVNHKEGRREGD